MINVSPQFSRLRLMTDSVAIYPLVRIGGFYATACDFPDV
jgi:hypothetical protein